MLAVSNPLRALGVSLPRAPCWLGMETADISDWELLPIQPPPLTHTPSKSHFCISLNKCLGTYLKLGLVGGGGHLLEGECFLSFPFNEVELCYGQIFNSLSFVKTVALIKRTLVPLNT